MDTVIYGLVRPGSDPFTIIPNSGNVYVTDATKLQKKQYSIDVYALDTAGHRGKARLLVNVRDRQQQVVAPPTSDDDTHDSNLLRVREIDISRAAAIRRRRRQAGANVLDPRYFIVNSLDTPPVDLFSVASYDPVVPEERFAFANPAPADLTIDEATGLVSRETGHVWTSEQETFDVIVTRSDDASCK